MPADYRQVYKEPVSQAAVLPQSPVTVKPEQRSSGDERSREKDCEDKLTAALRNPTGLVPQVKSMLRSQFSGDESSDSSKVFVPQHVSEDCELPSQNTLLWRLIFNLSQQKKIQSQGSTSNLKS